MMPQAETHNFIMTISVQLQIQSLSHSQKEKSKEEYTRNYIQYEIYYITLLIMKTKIIINTQ